MIHSPFDDFRANSKIIETPVEKIEGTFACQEADCYSFADIAYYYPDKEMLVWSCPQGHKNMEEDFEG